MKNHARVFGFKDWDKAKVDGMKLAQWACNQRRDFKRGAFKSGSKHQWKYDLLNSINFPW